MNTTLALRSAAKAKQQATAAVSSTTKLKNGLVVSSTDLNGPVSHLVLAFRAGSRYESAQQAGLSHHVRNFVGRDVTNYAGLSLVWASALSGATLRSFTTRDVFGVAMSVPRDGAAQALSILGHVAAQPAFKPWEVEDVLPTIRADNAYREPFDVLFEDIHRAAFRNAGLANSIYSSKRDIGKVGVKQLVDFAEKHLVSGNGAVVGINVEHDNLVRYGDEHAPIREGPAVKPSASPYKGGQWRRQSSGSQAHVLVAGEGASAGDLKALAAQAVLLAHLGTAPSLKFANNTGSNSALKGAGSASAFQAVHSDSGLAGVYLIANGTNGEAANAVKAVVAALKNPQISNIDGSKRRAALSVFAANEQNDNASIGRAIQVLSNAPEVSALVDAISKVTPSDVSAAAKKLSSNLSIASYGAISEVPYQDQL